MKRAQAGVAGDVVSATRATYDVIADDYAARTSTSPELRDWLGELTEGLAPGGLVVDLGCGPGVDAAQLRAQGFRCVGLDLSTSMLRLARDAGVPVVHGDLRALPLRDESVDVVWSCAALLHVPREETVATLAEWHRVTRPGGALSLSTSSGDGEGWEDVGYAPTAPGDAPRRRWFVHRTRAELLDAVSSAGWHVEHVGGRESHRVWHLLRARA